MIQQQTILKILDNSGAKKVKCIKTLKFKAKNVKFGDFIIIVIQKLRYNTKILSKVKKGQIFRALIVQLKKKIIKKNGFTIFFKTNHVILLNRFNVPIGNRLFGIIPKNIKNLKSIKFYSIASGLF